jgi:ferritin
MEINAELAEMMNDQLNFELYSGYIYLSMAAWFEENLLDGMAKWMHAQAGEEYEHAMKFWKFITDRGGRVTLKEIKGPKTEWSSPLEAWEEAYSHEKIVTERIMKIGELVEQLGDKSAIPFLNWFYDEQVEEEEQTMKVRDLLMKVGDHVGALYQLDSQLGRRAD